MRRSGVAIAGLACHANPNRSNNNICHNHRHRASNNKSHLCGQTFRGCKVWVRGFSSGCFPWLRFREKQRFRRAELPNFFAGNGADRRGGAAPLIIFVFVL